MPVLFPGEALTCRGYLTAPEIFQRYLPILVVEGHFKLSTLRSQRFQRRKFRRKWTKPFLLINFIWYWVNGYILPAFQFRLWYWCIRSCNKSHYFSTFFSDINSNSKLRFYWSVSKIVTEWMDILPTIQFRLWLVSNTAANIHNIKWIWIRNSVFVDQKDNCLVM